MANDFELFPGKNLSGLFEDIYNNQINKKKRISEVIAEIRKSVRHAGDYAALGPIIRDLIETSVKNDDILIKMANIAQKIITASQKAEGDTGYLTDEERKQLLQEIDEVEEEIKKSEEETAEEIDRSKNNGAQ